MNNLVTIANFVGDRFIPNLSKYETEFNTNYIAPYQKDVLIKLLGFDLYLQFEAGLSVETPEQKWIDLCDGSTYQVNGINKQNAGVKDIIAYYVYCKWVSANFEELSGHGVINTTTENAEKISPENKITSAWNNMLNYYYLTYNFIIENETDYPNFDFTVLNMMTYGF